MIVTELVLSKQDQKVNLDPAELSFYLSDKNKNSIAWPFSHNRSLEYLTGQIARQPRNLYPHVQRIHHCYVNDLIEQLYAAILDLFICLRGDKGFKLRERMFMGVKSKLPNEQKRNLKKSLELGGNSPFLLPVNRYSIFGTGSIGTRLLVRKTNTKAAETIDPLTLAIDHIEYSQLDEAKEVLEKAIIKQPDREDLTAELFELYKSMRDTEGFLKTYQLICGLETPLRSYWDDFNTLMVKDDDQGKN